MSAESLKAKLQAAREKATLKPEPVESRKSLSGPTRERAPKINQSDNQQRQIINSHKQSTSVEHQEPNKTTAKINVPRVVQSLMDALTDDDLIQVAATYRDALQATQRHWEDTGEVDRKGRKIGRWVVQPDFKTRIAAANMIAAYKEGLPVQRQIVLTKAFEGADATLERLQQSPELARTLAMGQPIEIEGIVVEGNRDSAPPEIANL